MVSPPFPSPTTLGGATKGYVGGHLACGRGAEEPTAESAGGAGLTSGG